VDECKPLPGFCRYQNRGYGTACRVYPCSYGQDIKRSQCLRMTCYQIDKRVFTIWWMTWRAPVHYVVDEVVDDVAGTGTLLTCPHLESGSGEQLPVLPSCSSAS